MTNDVGDEAIVSTQTHINSQRESAATIHFRVDVGILVSQEVAFMLFVG